MICVLNMRTITWIVFFVQINLTFGTATGSTSTISTSQNSSTIETTSYVTVSNFTTTDINNATDNTSMSKTIDTTTSDGSSTSASHNTTSSSDTASSTANHKDSSTCAGKKAWYEVEEYLMVVAIAGGVVVLAFIWSICVCCCYKRKLNRSLSKRKMSAKDSVLLKEMNGKEPSSVLHTLEMAGQDRKFSSDMHSNENEHEDRMSDLYDLTDPDYEDADAKFKVEVSEKPGGKKDGDEDDGDDQYDVLNIEDENTKRKRNSNYERAKFKSSKEDIDMSTYDTTETCKRIVSDEKLVHQENPNNRTERQSKVSSGCTESEPPNDDQIKNSESNNEVVHPSENQTPVPDDKTEDTKILQTTTNLNNNETHEPQKSNEKAVKTEVVDGDKISSCNYEFVKPVEENNEKANSEDKTQGDTVKDETSSENKKDGIDV